MASNVKEGGASYARPCSEECGVCDNAPRPKALDKHLSLLISILVFTISITLGLMLFLLSPRVPIPRRSLLPYPYASTSTSPLEDVGSAWENLKGAEHCLRFATRQYTARLVNVPSDVPLLRACRETPVEIHGVSILPNFCQDLGIAGGVWGYWTIDFQEPACLTRWSDFIDRGCEYGDLGNFTSMTRRFEATLQNMQHGDDWRIMCTTTPADLRGFHFPTPTMCERWDNVWGVWEVDDLSCTLSEPA